MARLPTWVLVLAAAVWSVVSLQPPAPGAEAQRAFASVERLGARPHVAGSPAADAAREYLLDTLRGIGLEPRVQDTVGVNAGSLGDGTPGAARVRNIVATVPGTAPTGRVTVVAHYDSVQSGPGANDDGAGVATLLETARALAADRPRNDVTLLFTDAEEACLCGAEAFVAQAPEATGGVVLNVEARGTTGPVIMFETTAGNGPVVDRFAAAAPHPVATSFAVEVYRILPNDTDFSPFRDSGRYVGLNSAYIDGSAAYHGPQDTPDRMDLGTLQMHIDNTTALVREFGRTDLTALRGADATYFPVLGTLVRYPGWLVWPLAGSAALVALAGAVAAARRTSAPRVLAGVGAGLLPLVVAPALAQLAWWGLTLLRPGYAQMDDPWRPVWDRAALACLVAAVVVGWVLALRRRVGTDALAAGGLVWLAVLGPLLAALAPGGSYLTTLPALAGGIALLVGQWIARALAAVVAVVVLVPTAVLFFPALGLAAAALPAFVLALLGLALVPVLADLPRLTPAVALVAAVGLGITGFAQNAFTAERPAPSQLMYLLDADAGTARWISAEAVPGEWTAQYVTGRETLALPGFDGAYSTGPAPPAALPPAQVDLTREGSRVTARLVPRRPVRLVALRADGIVSATVNGAPVPVRDGRLDLVFHAPPPEGLDLRLVQAAPGPVDLQVTDGSDGLDGLPGLTPRPPETGAVGSHTSDLVAVTRRVSG
ncbi:M20/M25/M40 family metallo-hydrolase [Pseudonocardia xishanensis]|uniref:M20/M25/M40 family metallo-hydrolase n=1 Tax=Pseudonocardia xishanensis TaxID=630995 RepID=UPI0031EA4E23